MKQPDPVKEAQRILINGDQSLFGTLPVVIKNMIDDQCWLSHKKQDGSSFSSFRELVEYKLYWGLETPFDDLVYFCRKDTECVRLLEANRGELGSHGGARDQGGHSTLKKNTADHWKLRLKRDRPDLYERVIAGDLTANAAAIEAGFRKPPKPRPTTPLEILDYAGEVLKSDNRLGTLFELMNALSPAELRAAKQWLQTSRAA